MSHFRIGQFIKNKYIKRTLKILTFSSVVAYLHQNSTSKIQLFYEKTNESLDSILEKCNDLKCDFKPTFWLKNHHLQTIYITLKKVPLKFPHQRETFVLQNESEVYIDWIQSDNHKEDAPTIFIMPGFLKKKKKLIF